MHHTQMMRLCHKLVEDTDSPKYIFSEPRAGYRMPEGETRDQEENIEVRKKPGL